MLGIPMQLVVGGKGLAKGDHWNAGPPRRQGELPADAMAEAFAAGRQGSGRLGAAAGLGIVS